MWCDEPHAPPALGKNSIGKKGRYTARRQSLTRCSTGQNEKKDKEEKTKEKPSKKQKAIMRQAMIQKTREEKAERRKVMMQKAKRLKDKNKKLKVRKHKSQARKDRKHKNSTLVTKSLFDILGEIKINSTGWSLPEFLRHRCLSFLGSWEMCRNNLEVILEEQKRGQMGRCFHCFGSPKFNLASETVDSSTALCNLCGIDSVIPGSCVTGEKRLRELHVLSWGTYFLDKGW